MNVSGITVIVVAAGVAIASFALLPSLSNSRLVLVEQLISRSYSTPSISTGTLQSLLEQPTPPVIFDVRKPEEYSVSHLPQAINVNPNLSAAEFMQRYGEKISGKQLVFYCSVGQRSSALADRISGLGERYRAKKIVNLRGGIFRWASNGLPMKNHQGTTVAIHPYNKLAAKLLPPELQKAATVKP